MKDVITKTNYLTFLQCPKALWLSAYQSQLATPPDVGTRRRMQIGHQVDQHALELFPNGRHIPYRSNPIEMAQLTAEMLASGGVDTLFQATFSAADLLVKTDIITRLETDQWHLIEVKSSTKYDPAKHLPDVAFQLYVMQAAGLEVGKISWMHLNKECRAPDLSNLFTRTDVTAEAQAFLPQVTHDVEQMREVIRQGTVPDEFIGKHCHQPYPCPYKAHCWQGAAEVTVYNIPRLSKKNHEILREARIVELADIPAHVELTANQQMFVSLHREQRVEVNSQAIQDELEQLVHPLHFFDLETIDHAVPEYDGCAPYQQVPFQFSCHILYDDGDIEHSEFLHTKADDPRPALIEALLDHLHAQGHIVVYSKGFEKGRLAELAQAFPAYAHDLEEIIGRLWDQLDIFKKYYKHYQFNGSNSLKNVLPILTPQLSYKSLAVQNGTQAQITWEELIQSPDPTYRQTLDQQLRDYCCLDTLAMVEIHRHLIGL